MAGVCVISVWAGYLGPAQQALAAAGYITLGAAGAFGIWLGTRRLIQGIGERHRVEALHRLDEARLEALVSLNQMGDSPLPDITHYAMEEAVRLTESELGYIALVSDDESTLHMHAWSATAMAECRIKDKPLVYPVTTTGLWGEAVRQRRPVITNDYQTPNPWKKGYPTGHVALSRHMNVPIFDNGRIVVVAGVGNKPRDYDESDVRQLTLLMNGMWQIVQRKRAQAEREQLLREVEAKNKELESLLYAASHDMRSPLINMQGFSSDLERACGELAGILPGHASNGDLQGAQSLVQQRIPTALHFIRTSAEKMDSLIAGLLRVSRTGRVHLRFERLDLDRMIESILASMKYQIEQAGAQIEVAAPLPSCWGDSAQINQAFSNLLDNALKYRDPVRPLVIHIGGRLEGSQAVYCVEDNGRGIEAQHQGKIWELFHRLDPTGGTPGEGIGLTLVRRIIERHNGRAWVESEAGRGSRFSLALPARGGTDAAARAEGDAGPKSQAASVAVHAAQAVTNGSWVLE